jgi:hypothetical protein
MDHAEMSTQEKTLTIFGAEETNTAIGNLVQSSVTNWLPVLGSYTVANDDILKPEPGYVLYNTTNRIVVTQVSTWFTRWLATSPLTYTATNIRLKVGIRRLPTCNGRFPVRLGFRSSVS